MIPWQTLDRADVPGFGELTLHQRGQIFVIRKDGAEWMGSHTHRSEDLLATRACEGLRERDGVRVLIGGLGLGFTLRAALDALAADAEVEVAELAEAAVRWNRGPLGPLAGRPLDDPRTKVLVDDVANVIAAARSRYDAIMLDVDNGPDQSPQFGNPSLYSPAALAKIARGLRPGGTLAIWAAGETPSFLAAFRRAGYAAERVRTGGRGASRGHIVWIGRPVARTR